MIADSKPNIPSQEPVIIQDIIITSKLPGKFSHLSGEFGNVYSDERSERVRLYGLIKNIMDRAAYKHKSRNYDGNNQLRENKKNHITRVVTSEFLFYTKQPFTLEEFARFQEKLIKLASLQPNNLYLILASFAVKTPDAKIMNVVVHMQCGVTPQIHFLVKNTPCLLDPVYTLKQHHKKQTLWNLHEKDQLENYNMLINGESHPFTYDTVVECKTAGNESFYSCVDIGSDHAQGIAKTKLDRKILRSISEVEKNVRDNPIPTQCSHVVPSGSTSIYPEHALGTITHADATCTNKDCKNGIGKLKSSSVSTNFGGGISIMPTHPAPCDAIPVHFMEQVYKINESLNAKHASAIQSSFLPGYTDVSSLNNLSKAPYRIDPVALKREKKTLGR